VAIASRSDEGAIDRSDWYDVVEAKRATLRHTRPTRISFMQLIIRGTLRASTSARDRSKPSPNSLSFLMLTAPPTWSIDSSGPRPVLLSPHDPNTLYHAGERLFKTTDGGVRWQAISPDLTAQ